MSYDNYQNLYRRNMLAEPTQLYSDRDLWTPTSDQKFMLGCQFRTNDGRAFRYAKAGGLGLSKCLITASPPKDAQAITSTIQTAYGASAGAKQFDVLLSTGNAWANNYLRDGVLLVSDGGTAMGDCYRIKDNIWSTSDTVMKVEIADAGGLRNAIAATDDVILFANKNWNTVVAPTNATGTLVGVPLVGVTANYYYWAQYRGVAPVLTDGTDTIVDGDAVMVSTSVPGALALVDASADDVIVGICHHAQAVDECSLVDLLIP